MNVRIANRGNASSAAGPADPAQRRYLNGRIIAEFECELILQGILHSAEQVFIPGYLVQPMHSANISKHTFRIDLFIDVKGAAIASQMGDVRAVIVLFAGKQLGKKFTLAGKLAEICRRRQAPGS